MGLENVTIFDHPLIRHKVAILRDEKTSTKEFRELVEEITTLMVFEAFKDVPTKKVIVKTPLEETEQEMVVDNAITIVPILRAGLIFTDEAIDILPQACIRHIGMYRDEKTLQPVWYYNKVPLNTSNSDNTYVYITDPMLATGNSLLEAIKLYVNRGIPIKNIKCLCIICAPQGIENIHKHFPDVEIITAAVDESLNDKGYIVPGMGDAGDRIFNTL